jgi:purine-binding chemotaxis protein CheW
MTDLHLARREHLHRRLRELEGELTRVQGELVGLGPGEQLPGVYLVLEAGGLTAALPAARVAEIVRLVECTPLPEAPVHVLGTFSYRGDPVVALDLGAYLRGAQQPSLEAHMLVLSGSRPVALVVDRVRTLVETLVVAEADALQPNGWLRSGLVAGLCRVGDELVPLLDIEPLLEGVAR